MPISRVDRQENKIQYFSKRTPDIPIAKQKVSEDIKPCRPVSELSIHQATDMPLLILDVSSYQAGSFYVVFYTK